MMDKRSERLEALTEVGSEKPMGRLLRRYWWPIAGTSDLATGAVRPVRLLGESLALFRDLGGKIGLIDRHCAHRGADLTFGFTEASGLRCAYHGWVFNKQGLCQQAPYEEVIDPRFCERRQVRLKAYDVKDHGGMIWAYLGPQPPPEIPDWEFFHWTNGFRQIVISEIPCNWLQCQENSVDPVHFEWQHSNYSLRRTVQIGPYFPKHVRLAFEEFEHGIVYRRLREGVTEHDPLWRVGRVCLWPNAVFPGNHVEFRVPIDQYTTLSVGWFFDRVPREREPYIQGSIPVWHAPTFENGRPIDTHVINQDFMAWIGQGPCVDRGKEHLGKSDEGVAMLRRILLSDIKSLEQAGTDPKGVIRDPARAKKIVLPVADREQLISGLPLEMMLKDQMLRARLRSFIFQAGQPDDVRQAFVEAMGIADIDLSPTGPVDLLARQ